MTIIAELIEKPSAGALERALYRAEQHDLVHQIKRIRGRAEISRLALSGEYRKGAGDQAHPWFTNPRRKPEGKAS